MHDYSFRFCEFDLLDLIDIVLGKSNDWLTLHLGDRILELIIV